jgi:hypothetical protein
VGEVCTFESPVDGELKPVDVSIPSCDAEASLRVGDGFRLAETRNTCPSQTPLRRENENGVSYVWEACV